MPPPYKNRLVRKSSTLSTKHIEVIRGWSSKISLRLKFDPACMLYVAESFIFDGSSISNRVFAKPNIILSNFFKCLVWRRKFLEPRNECGLSSDLHAWSFSRLNKSEWKIVYLFKTKIRSNAKWCGLLKRLHISCTNLISSQPPYSWSMQIIFLSELHPAETHNVWKTRTTKNRMNEENEEERRWRHQPENVPDKSLGNRKISSSSRDTSPQAKGSKRFL